MYVVFIGRLKLPLTNRPQFTILLHYGSTPKRPTPVTALLRSHFQSVRNPQFRFSIKGLKGTFTKAGVDVQEDQLKTSNIAVSDSSFGSEPEEIHGTLELLQQDSTVKSIQ